MGTSSLNSNEKSGGKKKKKAGFGRVSYRETLENGRCTEVDELAFDITAPVQPVQSSAQRLNDSMISTDTLDNFTDDKDSSWKLKEDIN